MFMIEKYDESEYIMRKEILEKLKQKNEIPTLPGTAYKIMQMALDPEASLNEMAKIIMQDVSLSTRILKVVNSSYFSFSNTISSISQAVVILGLNMVKNIALSLTVLDSLNNFLDEESYKILLNRSINTAVAAQAIAEESKLVAGEDAFLVGLLQELGLFMFAHVAPAEFLKLNNESKELCIDIKTTIKENLQIEQSEIGYEIAKTWELPPSICIAIRYYSAIEEASKKELSKEDFNLVIVGYLSSIASEIYAGSGKSLSITRFKEGYTKYLNKTPEEAEETLTKLSALIKEAAESYQIKIEDTKDFTQILQDANSELGKLNFKYEQMYRELKAKNAEISEKNIKLAKLTEELDKKNKMLNKLATIDGLTGIYNHRYFQEFLEHQFQQAKRGKHPIAVIMFDIDHFKKFNDTYGHQFGDVVLKELVRVVQATKRVADMLARYPLLF